MITARFPVRAPEEETKYACEVKKTCDTLNTMAIKLHNILFDTVSRHSEEETDRPEN